MGTFRGASVAAAVAVIALAATGCGEVKGDAAASDTVGAAADAQPAAGAEGRLGIRTDGELGRVLTDVAGLTLYRFDKGSAEPPKSSCEGDCATTWPPVPAGGAQAPEGVDSALLGEVQRADGSKQLTVAGWPMYRYAKDTQPGDQKGQGVGGVWFAAAPDGKKAADRGAAEAEQQPVESAAVPADLPGLSVRKDPELGEIVIDGAGMTVYRFKPDTQWPMVSKCAGDCVKKWPVVPPVPQNDTRGITEKNYQVLDRPDGLKQQSINCWPVYTFSGDKKPGDTNGQGLGGTWYAVSPAGKLVGVAG
ncbi:SCO0930 family lipoprotein [Streptomyces sp. NPDC006879]|uniref:SCO0930 family lipoprotein n=1 Tax=Streptomyces sp. NPDC006879 TaxID=3364767 RepID=UPI0036C9D120